MAATVVLSAWVAVTWAAVARAAARVVVAPAMAKVVATRAVWVVLAACRVDPDGLGAMEEAAKARVAAGRAVAATTAVDPWVAGGEVEEVVAAEAAVGSAMATLDTGTVAAATVVATATAVAKAAAMGLGGRLE